MIKQASIELDQLNPEKVVKVAGVLNRLFSWVRSMTDPDYRNAVNNLKTESVSVKHDLEYLHKEISNTLEAIKDGKVDVYNSSLERVKEKARELSNNLTNLSDISEAATPPPTARDYSSIDIIHISPNVKLYGTNQFKREFARYGIKKEAIVEIFDNPETLDKIWENIVAELKNPNLKILKIEKAPTTALNINRRGEDHVDVKIPFFNIPGYAFEMDMSVRLTDELVRETGQQRKISLKAIYDVHVKHTKIAQAAKAFVKPKNIPYTALPDSFWIKYVQMCQRLGVDPLNLGIVIYRESAFSPTAAYPTGTARGFIQFIRSTGLSIGFTEDTWDNFCLMPAEEQLPWVEKYFNVVGRGKVAGKSAGQLYRMVFGGFNNPDGSLYANLAHQKAYAEKHPGAKFANPGYQQKAVEQNSGYAIDTGNNGERAIYLSTVEKKIEAGLPAPIKSKILQAVEKVGNNPPPAAPAPKQFSELGITPSSSENDIFETKSIQPAEPKKVENDMDKELNELQEFLGIKDAFPLYHKVSLAAVKKELPSKKFAIKITGNDEYRILYANAVSNILKDFDIENNIYISNNININCTAYGDEKITIKSAGAICDIVSDEFARRYDLSAKVKFASECTDGEVLSENRIIRAKRLVYLRKNT